MVVGDGIDGLLGNLVRLLVVPGDAVVKSDGAYPTFNYHVAGFGGVLYKVPYVGDTEDLPALIARAHEVDARLVYFANPDNPMGSWVPGAAIAAALRDGAWLAHVQGEGGRARVSGAAPRGAAPTSPRTAPA